MLGAKKTEQQKIHIDVFVYLFNLLQAETKTFIC